MSKRKREVDPDPPDTDERTLDLQVSRLRAKIGQGVKTLHNALKLARGFERQKLGRRQKTAKSEPHTLLRLREEVIVLKQLDLEKTARSRLLKTMLRTKRVSEHPAFIKIYGPDPSSQHVKPGAEATVVGRLFGSNPVKQALSEVMKSTYHVLGIPPAPNDTEDTKKSTGKKMERKAGSGTESDFVGFSGDEDNNDSHIRNDSLPLSESGDDDDMMLEYAKDRLASSEEDSDDDGLAVDTRTGLQQTSDHQTSIIGRREDLSVSLSENEYSGSGDEQDSRPSQSLQQTSRTAFLPSLTMGGYYSGSDSEGEEEQYHGPALPKPRNNRRGQRERQRLAELKHGQNAKHLGKKPQDDRRSGWDAKRGAVGASHNSNRRSGERHSDQRPRGDGSSARAGRRSDQSAPKSRDDHGTIHPSWEAAKKRKMQDQTQASFQGKKITFD